MILTSFAPETGAWPQAGALHLFCMRITYKAGEFFFPACIINMGMNKKNKDVPKLKKIEIKKPPQEQKLKEAPEVVIAKAIHHMIIKDKEKWSKALSKVYL